MSFDAVAAAKALQSWYNPDLYGLYRWDDPNIPEWFKDLASVAQALNFGDFKEQYQETERWWNSANAIGALIDYMAVTGDRTYLNVLDNTFSKAQNAYTVTSWKVVPPEIDILKYTNFLNRFYDDEGWWALTWIKAYDLTKDQKYLDLAVTIGQDMTTGWDNTFGGGIYWAKDHKGPDGQSPYKNAIANELFMEVTARLYLRTKDARWKNWALKEWDWFAGSGLIWGTGRNFGTLPNQNFSTQPEYLINDSLNTSGVNDGTQALWTYNHGVILRALCDLSIILGDPAPRFIAERIADAAIAKFAPNAILTEVADTSYGAIDHCQFKGVFIRNLASLFGNDYKPTYSTFIKNNATSVLANGNASSQFGAIWSRPPDTVDFVRQTAAIDAINAANRVLITEMPTSLRSILSLVGQQPSASVRKAIGGLTSSARAWVAAVTT
jgi:predicted alpha-1,6-mannanase (GH76 family)